MMLRRVAWLLVYMVAIQGCAVFTSVPVEERVAQRSQERLDLMWQGQMEQSYAFTTPAYRSARTWQQYSRNWQGVGMWISATVAKVECVESQPVQKCESTVRIDYKLAKQEPGTTHIKETWVLVQDGWYLYQKI